MLSIVNNCIKILIIEIFLGNLKSIVSNASITKCTLKFTLLFKKNIQNCPKFLKFNIKYSVKIFAKK